VRDRATAKGYRVLRPVANGLDAHAENAARREEAHRMANALMLGGGAPTLTLQSGALAALLDKEVKFDAISTAGAGMLVGLLYAAPRGTSPRQALENTRDMGVHDSIYDLFPVNFKVFHKPGSLADAYRRALQALPRLVPGQDAASRQFADWMALMFAAWCPSDLTEKSLGLCDHAPWVDELVDFDKLKSFPGEFYMNAYCIEDQEMAIFTKEQITPDHFRAALAFPFVYPPFKFNGKTYIEGSAIDTLCFEGLLKYREERLRREKAGVTGTQKLAVLEPLRNVVVFDVLSSRKLIREPRSLYDAWVQSIMIPLVEIAKDDIRLFEQVHNQHWSDEQPKLNLLRITFEIPDEHWPYVLDWSYSNLSKLYDIGYAAGLKFYDENQEVLRAAALRSAPRSQVRAADQLVETARSQPGSRTAPRS
jgi:NTE family protein